jgi:hypothetical protein
MTSTTSRTARGREPDQSHVWNTLAPVLPHPGPGIAYNPYSGFAWVGQHAGGTAALWRLFIPDVGTPNGLIIGDVASGTTTLATNIATSAAHAADLSVWAGGRQGARLAPDLHRLAVRTADAGEVGHMLTNAVTIIDERSARATPTGHAQNTPTAATPGILIFLAINDIDWDAELVRLFAQVVNRGPENCVAIIAEAKRLHLRGGVAFDQDTLAGLCAVNAAVLQGRWGGGLGGELLGQYLVDTQAATRWRPPTGGIDRLAMTDSAIRDAAPRIPNQFPSGSATSGVGLLVGRSMPFRGWYPPAGR